ncbi:MAG TPA: mechanosensitive ion channel family protein [Xanthobacteraceae bacterium]|nr:mechanosensitive ion channel family protein [Xanthobacteraceae bacterium]
MWQDFVQPVRSLLSGVGRELAFAPPWVISVVIIVGTMAAAWALHAAFLMMLRRLLDARRIYLRSVIEQTRNPTRLALVLIALAIALPIAPLSPDNKTVIVRFLVLGTICLLGWVALTAAHITANLYLMRFGLDLANNLLARKHVTQVRVLLRATDTVIVIVTVGFALMTFSEVRQYGVSLFASAGVAGVVFGLAAQPVLSNLIAGVQLAVTQPIRLEDAVTVQNQYGWIEEINATYVVIRLEDQRRMIVPLNYFIQQPFYNWTRHAAPTIGKVVLYLDYTAPMEAIRKRAAEIVAETKQGKPRVTSVQVTDASAETIQVQILIDSDSAAITGDLAPELRERLIAFLQREHPEALPHRRNEIVEAAARKPDAALPWRPG